MKILLPVHHFPPRYSSGAELYTFQLAQRLIEAGHDPKVVCLEAIDEGRPDALSVREDVFHGVPVVRLSFDIFHSPQRRRWDYDNDLLFDWFSEYLTANRPDVMHLQAGYLLGIAPVKAGASLDIPMAITLHDFWYLCPRHTLQKSDGTLCAEVPANPAACAWCRKTEAATYQRMAHFGGALFKNISLKYGLHDEISLIEDRRQKVLAALRQFDVVISPSHFLANRFSAYIAPEKLHVVRFGLSPIQTQATQVEDRRKTIRFGYIGQIAPHKGVHTLIDAFQRLREAKTNASLQIYGNLQAMPDYVAHLRELAAGKPNIIFQGKFPREEIVRVLSSIDVLVVPSNWYENSPMAIQEAQSAGIPVIASALGGMAELVQHDVDGLHFAVNDSADLARQMQRIVDSPDLLIRLRDGVKAPPPVEDEMKQLLELYQVAINAHQIPEIEKV